MIYKKVGDRKYIFIIFALILINVTFGSSRLQLPKIPIYSDEKISFAENSPFLYTPYQEEAFYNIKLEPVKNYVGIKPYKRNFTRIASIAYIASQSTPDGAGMAAAVSWFIDKIQNPRFFPTDLDRMNYGTVYRAILTDKNDNEIFSKKIHSETGERVIDLGVTAIGIFTYVIYLLPTWYGFFDSDHNPLPSSDLFWDPGGSERVGSYFPVSPMFIPDNTFNFLEKENFFNIYTKIYRRVDNYHDMYPDYTEIDTWLDNKRIGLDRPKGEFETSSDYNKRKKEEEIYKQSIRAQYKQKKAQIISQNNLKKEKIKRKISKDLEKVVLEKNYEFSVSNYNADEQSFSFYITDDSNGIVNDKLMKKNKDYDFYKTSVENEHLARYSFLDGCWCEIVWNDDYIIVGQGNTPEEYDNYDYQPSDARKLYDYEKSELDSEEIWNTAYARYCRKKIWSKTHTVQDVAYNTNKKKVIVPIRDAKNFKANIPNLTVKKIIYPSLYGEWVSNSEYNLYDTRTNTLIPWEGEVPMYANPLSSKNPPDIDVSISIEDENDDQFLDALEKCALKVTLHNKGKGPSKAMRVVLSQDSGDPLFYDVEKVIDGLTSGEKRTEFFDIQVPENIKDGKAQFTFTFLESQGFEPAPIQIIVPVRAVKEPILAIQSFGIDEEGGDGMLEPMKLSSIKIRIQNQGQGLARDVDVDILRPRNATLPYYVDSKKIGDIAPGQAKDIVVQILPNKRASVIELEMNINEKRPHLSIKDSIKININKKQNKLQPLIFEGDLASNIEIKNIPTLDIDIEKNIPKSKTSNSDAIAIIFGIEQYKDISDVTFAERDAAFIKEYFINTLGIPESRIYFQTNNDVTKAEFDKVFDEGGWIDKRRRTASDIYFYYAGHGAPDIKEGKAYLIPFDGDPNYARQTGYALDDLYDKLNNFKANSCTVFLDACFTGMNRESEILLAGARPISIEVDKSYQGNVTVFSASSSKEISSSWPIKKHGLFSYFLMKGIQGNADLNSNNEITIQELGDYIYRNVSITAGELDREQSPVLSTNQKDRVLVRY